MYLYLLESKYIFSFPKKSIITHFALLYFLLCFALFLAQTQGHKAGRIQEKQSCFIIFHLFLQNKLLKYIAIFWMQKKASEVR